MFTVKVRTGWDVPQMRKVLQRQIDLAPPAAVWAFVDPSSAVMFLFLVLVLPVVLILAAVGCWWRYLRLRVSWVASLDGVKVELFNSPPTYLKKIPGDALLVPVAADAWIGRCMTKIVRDQGGDIIQEELHASGPMAQGEVRVVTGGKLKARNVIAYRMYDDENRVTPSLAASALDAAITAAEELGARELIFVDFSPAFAYSRDRRDGGFTARIVLEAVRRHRRSLRTVRVFIPEHWSYVQWLAEVRSAARAGTRSQPAQGTSAL